MMLRCEACGARVTTLRRGRCPICYLRWAESRPVGIGSVCAICSDRRRENLRLVEFQSAWIPMCHNCAARGFRLRPMPRTVEALRQTLARDRRWNDRRTGEGGERVSLEERRDAERRAPLCDEVIDWLDAEDLVIEVMEADGDDGLDETEELTLEPTRIVDTEMHAGGAASDAAGTKPNARLDAPAS